jgi:hypothetical protein
MNTNKIYHAEILHKSKEFQKAILDNEWFIKNHNRAILDSLDGRSMPTYWILEQTEWSKNSCRFYLNICDGKQHQTSMIEKTETSTFAKEKTLMAIETCYFKDVDGNTMMDIEVTNVKTITNTDLDYDNSFTLAIQKQESLITKN